MAMFVHLAPQSRAARIRRNGVARMRSATVDHPRGIFAVPVTRNFFISHQWLRELRRRGEGQVAGVYFRVPDDEVVWIGHYGRAHAPVTAAQAVAEFMGSESREGWEVVVPRAVAASEIHRVRLLPQVVGWRYAPGSNGKAPFCTCPYCTRGMYGTGKLREAAAAVVRSRPQ